jgi:hypothetical protein
MRSSVRVLVLPVRFLFAGLVVSVALAFAASSAQAVPSFGVEESNFEAGTCKVSTCTYAGPVTDVFTQAAGHPNFGITSFEFNSVPFEVGGVVVGHAPVGNVRNIRVDIPAGLAANPEALGEKCPVAKFNESKCATEYPNSRIGTNELTIFTGTNATLPAPVYDLEQPVGIPLEFGIQVPVIEEHILLVGHVSWHREAGVNPSGDYHEYFEIKNVSNAVPLLKSKLIFEGNKGTGFLTLPSVCSSSTASHLRVESYTGEVSETATHSKANNLPIGVEGCNLVPFAPTISVAPETTQSDQPDGATANLGVPQSTSGAEINSAALQVANVTLPEGMTINPSAAHGLTACTSAQIGIENNEAGTPVECPESSRLAGVTIESPDLPEPLSGSLYLGSPNGAAISGPPYTVYLDAESKYGVSVRLEGHVSANSETGRLTATFEKNPQLPFKNLRVSFKGGATAPLANPLTCGTAKTETVLTPFTGEAAAAPFSAFTVDSNGHEGACPSPLPLALTQSTSPQTPDQAGAYSPFTFNLARTDGQQYLSQIKTTLPAGLLGAIPSVPLCQEPQAAAGTCTETSKIGSVSLTAGSGSEPYPFSGSVYLTGPTQGAPYGLSIVVPAVAGPAPGAASPTFNLGNVVVRATINVDPYTSRLIVTSNPLPRTVGGIPLRLKTLSVTISRNKFLFNPTNCGVLATESVLTGTTLTAAPGSTQALSTPFQVGGCSALPFTPKFTTGTAAKTSKANGASLTANITQGANQANIKSVSVKLPKQLPSRLTTLQKACPEATFAANPYSCPTGSRVGGVTVKTPVLPDPLTGPVYFVSHGGAAFPDLDLLLNGDGVHVILVGNTNITGAVTTSTFASLPDVPITSVALNLPVGKYSALTGNGSLCGSTLVMPTTIVGQNGAKITQNTKLAVSGCGPKVLKRKISGNTALITLQTPAAGRVSGSGTNLKRVTRHASKVTTLTLKVPLSANGVRSLRKHGKLTVSVRLGFIPSKKGPTSKTLTTVTFR